MVALERKRKTSPDPSGSKRQKSVTTLSNILHSYSKLPEINAIPSAKSVPLDIFVWGTGSMCELGLGPSASTKEVKRPRINKYLTPEFMNGHKIVDFAVGGMHTLALDSNGDVWSWGGNDSGVLGRDTNVAVQTKSADADESEDEDGDLNEAESTPGRVEGLPSVSGVSDDASNGKSVNGNSANGKSANGSKSDTDGAKVVQLCATDNLSLALYNDGSVYAWGCFRNNEGLLGFLHDEILIQRTPRKMDQLKNIVQLAAGKDHILALDTKGIVYAWGNGQQFQLGRKILERHKYRSLEPQQFGLYNIKYISSGDFHCFAIDHDDNVYAWGLNQFGQCALTNAQGELEDGSLITKPTLIPSLSQKGIVELAGGEHHTLALTQSGQVLGWGRYDMKEVGVSLDKVEQKAIYKDNHGNARAIIVPTKLTFTNDDVICKKIASGSHHSFAVTSDGFVYSWGFGDTYGPGLGPLEEDVELPTRIVNTATKHHDIVLIGAGGQFSVSGGVAMDEDKAEDRLDKYEDME